MITTISNIAIAGAYHFQRSDHRMRCFEERLHTFRGWPHHFLRPDNLAKAGFRYTKNADLVECEDCGVKIGQWRPNDDPFIEHKKWSGNCPFVKRLSGVVPEEDTCGMYGIRPSERREKRENVIGPRYPMFTTKEERCKTFKDWPKSLKQKPEELADAGFFYMNVGDKTACFYCGVGCKDWEEHDVPWEEHAKWSPNCLFLQLHKGENFAKSFEPKPEESFSAQEPEKKEEDTNGKKDDEEVKIDNKATCKVCYDKEVGVVFVPCGHAACLDCAPALSRCHICRRPIERFIRIYMA